MQTIGIDLGTTNSLVAYWSEDGAKIIPNSLGSNLTPSVVSVGETGEIYIGQIAKERIITHPQLTASTFKRYMGTEKKYKLGKLSFSPEELSSLVIKSLKADAEAYFGSDVTDVIISVPAYFNDTQRKATKNAAELAGLKVKRLISEPTAAALSYGLHQENLQTKFLVFDLGGGTFDVSVLELFEGIIEVKAIAGDNFLGGEDFTELLISHFVEKLDIDYDKLDSKAHSLLYKKAEQCKHELTMDHSGSMNANINNVSYEIKIDRNEFESLVNTLLLRLRRPVERALRDVSLLPKDIDAVVLIGGATRMPVVKSVVSKMFGRLPFTNINPDEAVALGAAIQAALIERDESLSEVILTDVCPYSLGVSVAKPIDERHFDPGYFLPIIERNTPIPVSRAELLQTIKDLQKSIHIEIYQGESRKVENNIKIGELNFNVPASRAGEQMINIRYTYDINGILEVEAESLQTGVKKRVVIEKTPGSMTKEEIEESFKKLASLKIHPRDRAENKLLLARGERLYEESIGDIRDYIACVLGDFETVLSKQNENETKLAAERVKKAFDDIEGRFEF